MRRTKKVRLYDKTGQYLIAQPVSMNTLIHLLHTVIPKDRTTGQATLSLDIPITSKECQRLLRMIRNREDIRDVNI